MLSPGDVITIEPDGRHRHGASPATAMTYIAIHEYLDGRAAGWLELVNEEQYQGE